MSYNWLLRLVDLYRYVTTHRDQDNIILVSGWKGTGKSSLALLMLQVYTNRFGRYCPDCKKTTYKPANPKILYNVYNECTQCGKHVSLPGRLNLKKQILYRSEDIINTIRHADDYTPLIFDEGIRAFAAEDWAKTESKELNKMFAQMRTKHLTCFICIPTTRRINTKILNDYSTFWIRIYDYGWSLLFWPNLQDVKDRWNLDLMEKILPDINILTPKARIYYALRKHPRFFGLLKFPNVSQNLYARYKKLRDNAVYGEDNKYTEKEYAGICSYNLFYFWNRLSDLLAQSNRGMTKKFIAEKIFSHPLTGKPLVAPTTITKWINQFPTPEEYKQKQLMLLELRNAKIKE